ncbi:16S rRNA (uracil(1498)-N(3))-methyltransferase [Thiospirochaeta perfilievii]|uniref:Ribosomal RNA small subunit methyltransferase E n=1 Tax=Thiospirochaeta perfilievii TaxID=252967 RepID=A0A5C1QCK8_9SPIO|nr:RsmE family RNA methyltransferase [Thiospirochaeta perfilievii]QEN04840.1 16S rRNA (uracil(1498)-N(3))-methyltransferase [Thiospirochaeta perfilievii]
MKQLILPKDYSGEEIYTLPKEDSHYLLHVQRKEIGYSLNLLDIDNNRYQGKLVKIEDNRCILKLSKILNDTGDNRKIILFQSIPKGKKIDLMIRQAVETGVSIVVPIMADHSIPTFKEAGDRKKKKERWNKIVKEASQQSGTNNITILDDLKTLKEALDGLSMPHTGLYFHQVPLKNRALHQLLHSSEKTIVLVIGPEGGLSKREVDLLDSYNFSPVLLGKNILRAETATTFSLGAVQMILNEQDEWTLK